jgi:hypothetical protein
LDKGVNKPFKGYLREQFEEWICTNGSRRWPSRAEAVQWVANAWDQVTTATIVDTWKSIGHKVADDDEDNIVANQPGTGQENNGDDEDDEAEDFVLYQVEEEREAAYPAPLLQHNFDNDDDDQPFVVDLAEEEQQQACDFHYGVGFTDV